MESGRDPQILMEGTPEPPRAWQAVGAQPRLGLDVLRLRNNHRKQPQEAVGNKTQVGVALDGSKRPLPVVSEPARGLHLPEQFLDRPSARINHQRPCRVHLDIGGKADVYLFSGALGHIDDGKTTLTGAQEHVHLFVRSLQEDDHELGVASGGGEDHHFSEAPEEDSLSVNPELAFFTQILDQGVVDGDDGLVGELESRVYELEEALSHLFARPPAFAEKGIGRGPVNDGVHLGKSHHLDDAVLEAEQGENRAM